MALFGIAVSTSGVLFTDKLAITIGQIGICACRKSVLRPGCWKGIHHDGLGVHRSSIHIARRSWSQYVELDLLDRPIIRRARKVLNHGVPVPLNTRDGI